MHMPKPIQNTARIAITIALSDHYQFVPATTTMIPTIVATNDAS